MCPLIRISDDLYSRLGELAEGFDTPANVIEKLLGQSGRVKEGKEPEVSQSKSITNDVIERA